MSRLLMVATVSKGGRIYLGDEGKEALGVKDGEKVQLVEETVNDKKVVFIVKVTAPEIPQAITASG